MSSSKTPKAVHLANFYQAALIIKMVTIFE